MIKLSMKRAGVAVLALVAGAGVAGAGGPKVATDITPVHGLVARVMQGIGEPTLIVPPGASPHGYAMRPSEARALDQADIVFWLGEPLTPWLEGPLEQLAKDAHRIELLEAAGTVVLPFREGARFEAHDHEEDGHEDAEHDEGSESHDDHEGHDHDTHEDHSDHDDHDHEGDDPHAWLLPQNAQHWLDVIAAELAEHDPENGAVYLANADAGKAEIAAAVDQISADLEPFQGKQFIVFHDAYQYFERGFGLSAAGAISLGDAVKPSPARIAEVRAVVKDLSVSCVFSEPQFNPGLVATVLEGTGAGTAVLDPLGAHLETGAKFYPTLLQNIGSAIAGCE